MPSCEVGPQDDFCVFTLENAKTVQTAVFGNRGSDRLLCFEASISKSAPDRHLAKLAFEPTFAFWPFSFEIHGFGPTLEFGVSDDFWKFARQFRISCFSTNFKVGGKVDFCVFGRQLRKVCLNVIFCPFFTSLLNCKELNLPFTALT